MTRPLAYITTSFGDEDLDVKAVAAKYCRTVYEAWYSPICPAVIGHSRNSGTITSDIVMQAINDSTLG